MTMTVQEREALVAQYAKGPQRIQEALARAPKEKEPPPAAEATPRPRE